MSRKPEVIAAPGYRTTVSRQNAEGSVRVTVQEAGVLQSYPADFPWTPNVWYLPHVPPPDHPRWAWRSD